MKKVEEMQFDMKNLSKSNDKVRDEHKRRLNLHDITLRNIKVPQGQLAQELHRRP